MRSIAQIKRERRAAVSTLPGAQPKSRILVADDDPTTGAALSLSARAERCEVVLAVNGTEAYRVLRTDDDFDAVVINPAMPGIDGLELIRYLKSENRLKRIPIIMLIPEHSFRLLGRTFTANATACLWKPAAADVLWRTVRMLLPQAAGKRKAA